MILNKSTLMLNQQNIITSNANTKEIIALATLDLHFGNSSSPHGMTYRRTDTYLHFPTLQASSEFIMSADFGTTSDCR